MTKVFVYPSDLSDLCVVLKYMECFDTEWRNKKRTVEIIFEQRKVLFVQNFNRIKIKIKNIDREETGENVSESWNEGR